MGTEERPPSDGAAIVYLWLADLIAGQIERGELQPGARLMAERDLAETYGVSYATVRRATVELRERGLIETIHGKGTFVRERH